MKKQLAVLVSALVLSVSAANFAMADSDNGDEESTRQFDDFNTDNSGDGIDQGEWNFGFDNNNTFDSWDTNRDGNLSRDEHRNGYFQCFDENGDGRIGRDEHRKAWTNRDRCGWLGR